MICYECKKNHIKCDNKLQLMFFLIELIAMYWLVTVPPGGQAVGDGALGPRGRTLQRETSFQTLICGSLSELGTF